MFVVKMRMMFYLRVEGEGLGEPEGVRIIFVIISKLLTLQTTSEMICQSIRRLL